MLLSKSRIYEPKISLIFSSFYGEAKEIREKNNIILGSNKRYKNMRKTQAAFKGSCYYNFPENLENFWGIVPELILYACKGGNFGIAWYLATMSKTDDWSKILEKGVTANDTSTIRFGFLLYSKMCNEGKVNLNSRVNIADFLCIVSMAKNNLKYFQKSISSELCHVKAMKRIADYCGYEYSKYISEKSEKITTADMSYLHVASMID